MTETERTHRREAAYSLALEMVAAGDTRPNTFDALLEGFEDLDAADLSEEMDGALHDALRTDAIHRHDIDPSWF